MNPAQLERIIRKMRVPVVRPTHVAWHGDPYYSGEFSTYNQEERTLFLRPDIDAFGLRHELGHVFDSAVLKPEHRALLLKWWRMPGRFWWWDVDHDPMKPGPEAGCEIFANVYARAAVTRAPLYYRFKKLIRAAYKEAGYGT